VKPEIKYTLSIYPSIEYRESFESYELVLLAVVVVTIFLFTIGVFAVYDAMVQRRQHKVLETAQQTTAIVKSLFPQEKPPIGFGKKQSKTGRVETAPPSLISHS
jgi:hypothetical protein